MCEMLCISLWQLSKGGRAGVWWEAGATASADNGRCARAAAHSQGRQSRERRMPCTVVVLSPLPCRRVLPHVGKSVFMEASTWALPHVVFDLA